MSRWDGDPEWKDHAATKIGWFLLKVVIALIIFAILYLLFIYGHPFY